MTSRCYPHPMGKRRAKHPFENNSFADAFLEWMGSCQGQHSIYALGLVFAALEDADVWDDGKRLSIEQSAERIHAEHPDVPRDLFETHVVGGSRVLRRNPIPNASSRSSTGSPSSGLTTTSASHTPPGSNPELGTLELL